MKRLEVHYVETSKVFKFKDDVDFILMIPIKSFNSVRNQECGIQILE